MLDRTRFERELLELEPPAEAAPEMEAPGDGFAPLSSTRLVWNGASAEQLKFMRRVYDAQVQRYLRAGRPRFMDSPAGDLQTIEGKQTLHREAIADCRAMLAQARQDLARDQARGDAGALALRSFGVSSGYRSGLAQFTLWQKYFAQYYNATRQRRLNAAGGEHGDKAVDLLAEYISGWLSPPGFGTHVQGRAVDLYAAMAGRTLGASSSHIPAWRASWLHRWLTGNAARYRFHPYEKEPWHWEHASGSIRSTRPAAPAPASAGTGPSPGGTAETGALARAVAVGERDESKLTDTLFRARHPELGGRRIAASEQQLVREWLDIRDRIVRPFLASGASRGGAAAQPTAGAGGAPSLTQPLGKLTRVAWTDPKAGRQPAFSYQFTPTDALWLARLLVGEAGGRDDPDNRAVVWALFNRFALFWYRTKPDLTSFLRAYSTVLQPVLNSAGAAQRHYLSADFKRTGGTYADQKHPEIPRGQLQRHLDLQARPWEQLPEAARRLALAAMSGRIPSPVGLASEFASTLIYYKQHHGGQEPTDQQWRDYTKRLASQKQWVWVGDRPGLNQRKNAFFVDARAAALPEGSVRVVSG